MERLISNCSLQYFLQHCLKQIAPALGTRQNRQLVWCYIVMSILLSCDCNVQKTNSCLAWFPKEIKLAQPHHLLYLPNNLNPLASFNICYRSWALEDNKIPTHSAKSEAWPNRKAQISVPLLGNLQEELGIKLFVGLLLADHPLILACWLAHTPLRSSLCIPPPSLPGIRENRSNRTVQMEEVEVEDAHAGGRNIWKANGFLGNWGKSVKLFDEQMSVSGTAMNWKPELIFFFFCSQNNSFEFSRKNMPESWRWL